MTSRTFHLGDLLSITHDYLVSPRHIDGVYDIINFVTGESHMTHQLPRACGVVKPWLLKQHPWLADVTIPDNLRSEDDVLSYLVKATAQWGANHEVEAMPLGMYVGREPIAELQEMAPNTPIIQVEIPHEDS